MRNRRVWLPKVPDTHTFNVLGKNSWTIHDSEHLRNFITTFHKSQLSLENKLLVYKVILKPVWTYGIQLWGTASNSNLEILERFQSKVLSIITDAPLYVPNTIIKRDLQIPTVKQDARQFSAKYRKRLDTHPNNLANTLFQE